MTCVSSSTIGSKNGSLAISVTVSSSIIEQVVHIQLTIFPCFGRVSQSQCYIGESLFSAAPPFCTASDLTTILYSGLKRMKKDKNIS